VKVVALGAVSFYIDRYISVRKANFTYGTSCKTPYSAILPSHQKWQSRLVRCADGVERLPGAFYSILTKVH
jgi:hypothetical protein